MAQQTEGRLWRYKVAGFHVKGKREGLELVKLNARALVIGETMDNGIGQVGELREAIEGDLALLGTLFD